MKKNSTMATRRKQIFKQKQLTIGMDLGDRFTYCGCWAFCRTPAALGEVA